MVSLVREELIKKFKERLESSPCDRFGKPSLDIQMASLDLMMGAMGYVPRRLPSHPEITDGRFGYYKAHFAGKKVNKRLPNFTSLRDAISLHNGSHWLGNPFRRLDDRQVFALKQRIVETVRIQKLRGGAITSCSPYNFVKFVDE